MGSKAVDRALTFSILEMTPSGMRLIKYVNVFEGIRLALRQAGQSEEDYAHETEWLYCDTFAEIQERLKV